MTERAVAIGLDGAAWHLLDPLIEDGVMPRLAQLRERGASGVLRSTIPVFTPPAWTSALTGVNPGRHGIYGFFEGHAQHERQDLLHSGNIKAPTLWDMTRAQGARAGIYNLPLTYPPRPLEGWMVSGMMTPGYGEQLKNFAWPPELEGRILGWAPDYVVHVRANHDEDWRDPALCERIVASLAQRRRVLEGLLQHDPPDVLFAMLEAPDRLQHVYYRYMDPADELHRSEAARRIRPHIARCFQAMDQIIGLLVDWAGPDGGVVVCSDHGFTAWEMSVHTNTLLRRWGYLKLKPGARALQTDLAKRAVSTAKKLLALRVLDPKLARQVERKTGAAVDWCRTRAFATPRTHQGIYVNLEGREPHGIVPPSQLQALKEEIAARFAELKGPDGRPATDRVWRSEAVFQGDELEGAPDLVPILRDHRYDLDDELFERVPFSDVTHMPRGVHHIDGIGVVAGPGVAPAGKLDGSVLDVTPTLLYLAGLEVPEGLDGSLFEGAFDARALEERPLRTTTAPEETGVSDKESPYSPEEEAQIEESLRGLGYV